MVLVIDGQTVAAGSKVKTFRGEPCYFVRIAQDPTPGKSGKVYVAFRKRDLKDEFKWSVFYPSVIGGEIKEVA